MAEDPAERKRYAAESLGPPKGTLTREKWDEYYINYADKLLKYLVYGYDFDLVFAQDVVHDAFIRLFQKYDQYDPSQALFPWLAKIALNIARNNLRSDHARRRREEEVLNRVPSSDSRDHLLSEIFFSQTVQWILENTGLSQFHCEIFLHCVQEGLEPKEIAQIMSDVPKRIRQQLWRMRKQIQERSGEYLKREDLLD